MNCKKLISITLVLLVIKKSVIGTLKVDLLEEKQLINQTNENKWIQNVNENQTRIDWNWQEKEKLKFTNNYLPTTGITRKPVSATVWAYGLGCCTAVIVFARMGVVILPLLRDDLYEKVIITMVGLAAGTLTGSSIFHLLPKAFKLDEKYECEAYIRPCVLIVGGLWLFLMIERLLNLIFHYKERRMHYGRQCRLDNILALPLRPEQSQVSIISLEKKGHKDTKKDEKLNDNPSKNDKNEKQEFKNGSSSRWDRWDSITSTNELKPFDKFCTTCKQVNKLRLRGPDKYRLTSNELAPIQFQEGSLSRVSTEAWLIVASDSFLDLVDGLAIGTAFYESILTGCSISLGVLLEELPHELGEFAVLLNAGLPFRQALMLKFAASTTTYLGLCLGIWLGSIDGGPYVFAVIAGMFLYISLVDMLPELNESALKSSRTSMLKGAKILVLQNIGLLIGISSIYCMAVYENVFEQL